MLSYLRFLSLLALVFTGSDCACPHGIQTSATVICPDQVGVFVCETVNASNIGWRFNNESMLFLNGNDLPGSISPELSNGEAVAYLVRRDVVSESNFLGNRTSILHYSPLPDTNGTVTIECISSGVACDTAVVQVYSKW